MQDTLTFPTPGSPPRFSFPEFRVSIPDGTCLSELSSTTSTPFVSAPSSPSAVKGFYFSAPTSPTSTWDQQRQSLSFFAPSEDGQFGPVQQGRGMFAQHVDMESSSQSISCWAQKKPHTGHSRYGSADCPTTGQVDRPVSSFDSINQVDLRCESTQADDSTTSSSRYEARLQSASQSHINRRVPFRKLQGEDLDLPYSKSMSYAFGVPFAWEERPGTPKTRSVASDASTGEDDAASVLLSESSDFEFSARFPDLEEPPMSPTPIASPASSFARLTYGSAQRGAMTDEQIWPLRPPPCLHSPVFPVKELIKNDANDRSSNFASLSSISAPQSPRSTRKFDVRGILCGLSSPTHKVFDPFLVAMEKAMEKGTDDFAVLDMRNVANEEAPRKTDVRHRRTRSSSPLKVFHWDDNASKSNSSSNGSSSMDEAKSKHPPQREIDARHNAKPLKGLKRWRFMGFLHRKCESVGASLEHGNRSSSMRSTGSGSNTSGASRRVSYSGEAVFMDMSNRRDCAHVPPPSISSPSSSSKPFPLPSPAPAKLSASSLSSSSSRSSALSPSPSTKLPTLSPSSSTSSAKGKLNVHHHRNGSRGPYAIHYDIQKAHSDELKKKTFLPYRQGLLGCLGLSSRSYRAIATLSKPLQSVS